MMGAEVRGDKLAQPVGRDELVYDVQFHLSSTKPQAYTK